MRSRQQGFTLIELMVSLLITLFIMMGVGVMFLSMKDTFGTENSLSRLQDSERLAVTMLTRGVQMAGYFPNPTGANVRNTALPAAAAVAASGTSPATPALAAGQGIVGTDSTFTVRYATANNDGIMNCHGQSNTSGADATYVYQFAISANNELTCSLNGGTPQVLTPNISAMALLYGVDRDADPSGSADTYLLAADVTTEGAWSRVRSVRITLTFVNPVASQAGGVVNMPNAVIVTAPLLNNLPNTPVVTP